MITLWQSTPRLLWDDPLFVVAICVSCFLVVVVAVAYPWSWRWLGIGLLAHFMAVGLLFGRGVAGLYPIIGRAFPQLRTSYDETTWLIRILLVVGTVAIIVGLGVKLWREPIPWKGVAGRLGALVVVAIIVWTGLYLVHEVRG